MSFKFTNPDEIYYKSFLLKREVNLGELDNLAQDELDFIMAEIKARLRPEQEVTREFKFIADLFYELALVKTLARERRDKNDTK